MRFYIYLFFLLIFPFFSFSQNKPQVKTEDLKKQLQIENNPSKKINLLLSLGKSFSTEQTDSSLIYFQEALDLAKKINLPEATAKSLRSIGLAYRNDGKYLLSLGLLREEQSINEEHNLDERLPDCFMYIGNLYIRVGIPDSAFYYFSKMEKGYLDIGKDYAVWRAYMNIAVLFDELNEDQKAGEYYERAFAIVNDAGNRMDLGYMLFIIGDYYFRMKDYEKYSPIAKQWIEFRKSSKYLNSDKQHKDFIFFFDEKNVTPDQIREAIEYEKKYGDAYIAAVHQLDLGHILKKKELYTEAIVEYEKAIEELKNQNAKYALRDAYHVTYELCKGIGQHEKALGLFEKYNDLQSELEEETVLKNLSELEVKYQTEKKDFEIQQKTLQRNILLGSSSVLGLLAIAIISLMRSRMKTNKQLAFQANEIQNQKIKQLKHEKKLSTFDAMIEGQENERQRVAKDLHDSIGGVLATIKSHVTAVGEEKDDLPQLPLFQKTMSLLDEVCDDVRRISHDMMPRALDLSGLAPALEDIVEDLQRKGIDAQLEIVNLEDNLDGKISTMLFRIVQELTHNIFKHAQAKNVLIQLIQNENTINLLVEDDGVGFDISKLKAEGIGLTNIRSRVEFLKGTVDFDSVEEEGTTVNISIPI